jgi:hypothetical protein
MQVFFLHGYRQDIASGSAHVRLGRTRSADVNRAPLDYMGHQPDETERESILSGHETAGLWRVVDGRASPDSLWLGVAGHGLPSSRLRRKADMSVDQVLRCLGR